MPQQGYMVSFVGVKIKMAKYIICKEKWFIFVQNKKGVEWRTLTGAKFVSGHIEGLHPVLVDIQVQSFAHVDGFRLAGVAVSELCSEEIHWTDRADVVSSRCCTETKQKVESV